MSRLLFMLAATAGLACAAGAVLPALSPVELRLRKSVSSATAQPDDRVEFEVAEDVRVDGEVVIKRGSLAWGTIAAAIPAGRFARKGRLAIDLNAVCLASGPLALQAWRGHEPPAYLNEASGDSLFSLPALPLMLFVQGRNVTMERGAELTAFTVHEAQVKTAGAESPVASCETGDAAITGSPSSNSFTSVLFRSNPVGAEIAVDGRFVGNTPSSLRLAPGEHYVSIRLPGRRAWERVVAITEGGDVNINAQLEELPSHLAEK
jgi:hypothetical protein